VAGVVGEGVQGLSRPPVGGQPEVDAAGLAGRPGDRGGTGLGSGVLGAAGPVQDRADLSQQLGVAELADARKPRQQLGLGVGGQPLADRLVEVGDGGQQGGPSDRRMRGNDGEATKASAAGL
jgi:hypothetical protein